MNLSLSPFCLPELYCYAHLTCCTTTGPVLHGGLVTVQLPNCSLLCTVLLLHVTVPESNVAGAVC
jgi:hypothetical protein